MFPRLANLDDLPRHLGWQAIRAGQFSTGEHCGTDHYSLLLLVCVLRRPATFSPDSAFPPRYLALRVAQWRSEFVRTVRENKRPRLKPPFGGAASLVHAPVPRASSRSRLKA